MVARNSRYHLVSVSGCSGLRSSQSACSKDLLPWADPYIARLVRRLQAEVRRERVERERLRRMREQLSSELPPSYPGHELDFHSPEDGSWSS